MPGKKTLFKNDEATAWLYLLPALFFLTVFMFYPTVELFIDSFFKWDGISPKVFVGVRNYIKLFGDREFWRTVINSFIFIIGTVPVGMAISLILALLIKKEIVGRGFFRTIFFSPVVTSLVAAGLVWIWLLNENYGIINAVLEKVFSLGKFKMQSDPIHAMLAVILMTIWKDAGYNMVIFLAGLNNIGDIYYEAASIDGANEWQKFWKITWPMLMPTTFFILLTRIIFTFRTFEQIYTMTKGGPEGSTTVFVYYIWEKAFGQFPAQMGYASAASIILLVIVLSVTFIQFRAINYKKA